MGRGLEGASRQVRFNLETDIISYAPGASHSVVTPPKAATIRTSTPLTSLWSGATCPMTTAHSLNGITKRVVPLRAHRGFCEVRGISGSLWWLYAAMSLGFSIRAARFPPSPFTDAMTILFPQVKFLSPSRPRASGGKIRIVFCDGATILSYNTDYWLAWKVPHVFDAHPSTSFVIPAGWRLFRHSFTPAHLGGCTDGVFMVCIMLPIWLLDGTDPQFKFLARQPWIPIGAMTDARISASTAAEPTPVTSAEPVVYCQGLEVLPHSLFPSKRLTARVRVRSVFNPSKWGSRRLSYEELAGVWDAPIGLQDYCKTNSLPGVLASLLHSSPGKILHLGADLLLSSIVRGGVFFLHFTAQPSSSCFRFPSSATPINQE